jgi:hypothetical protein
MAQGRVLYAGMELLDRQLVDRHGRPCGKVDDLELEQAGAGGRLYVSAILAGPGVLATRLGRRGLGPWLERAVARLAPSSGPDPVRIPFGKVMEMNNHVQVAVEAEDLATFATERWVRDHIVDHIRGSGHHAPE